MIKKASNIVKNKSNAVNLQMKDLQAIIKSCRKNGVASLKFGHLELNFEPKEPIVISETTPEPYFPPVVEAGNDFPRVRDDNSIEDSYELDDLKINDPEAYEKLIASGEMNAREN